MGWVQHDLDGLIPHCRNENRPEPSLRMVVPAERQAADVLNGLPHFIGIEPVLLAQFLGGSAADPKLPDFQRPHGRGA